jgi:hypothetical protein
MKINVKHKCKLRRSVNVTVNMKMNTDIETDTDMDMNMDIETNMGKATDTESDMYMESDVCIVHGHPHFFRLFIFTSIGSNIYWLCYGYRRPLYSKSHPTR